MNIADINKEIVELQATDLTATAIRKLANLYIVRDHYYDLQYSNKNIDGQALSNYLSYCRTKQRYQRRENSEADVDKAIKMLCEELFAFFHNLYSGTDTQTERIEIANLCRSLNARYGKV